MNKSYKLLSLFLLSLMSFSILAADYGSIIALRSCANGKYVMADQNGASFLIAIADNIGEWEKFEINKLEDNSYSLKGVNGKYVRAENAGQTPLISNSPWVGDWEKFKIIKQDDETYALQGVNGKYVRAENSGQEPLIANSPHVETWEKFKLIPIFSGPGDLTMNSNLRVKTVTAKGVYLFNGFIAEPLNFLPGITGNSFEHWWLEIETENNDRWFILQFGGKNSELGRHIQLFENSSMAGTESIGSASRSGDNPTIFTINSFKPRDVTMGQIYVWASRYHGEYEILSNNCQDFANRFFLDFNGSIAYDPTNTTVEVIDHSLTALAVIICNIQ